MSPANHRFTKESSLEKKSQKGMKPLLNRWHESEIQRDSEMATKNENTEKN
jgi:hypothetical protein